MSRHRWAKESSRRAVEAKASKRMASPMEPRHDIEPGRLLHRIRIENFVNGSGFEVLVKQGRRRNQIVAETCGRQSKPHGVDWLASELRKRLVVRWAR